MKKMLNNWQEDSTEEKASSKVSYLSFVSIEIRLVILPLDVQRRRTTEVVTSLKVEELKTTLITKTKARNATLLKRMILMNMMM